MNSRGICHRDVSLANIFTRLLPMEDLREKSEASTTACGWLDDFDCAFHSDISKLSSTLGEGVDRDGALSVSNVRFLYRQCRLTLASGNAAFHVGSCIVCARREATLHTNCGRRSRVSRVGVALVFLSLPAEGVQQRLGAYIIQERNTAIFSDYTPCDPGPFILAYYQGTGLSVWLPSRITIAPIASEFSIAKKAPISYIIRKPAGQQTFSHVIKILQS